MTSEDAMLQDLVSDLLGANCVTFYEALTVVHLARHLDSLDPATCSQLIQLHDAPQTTHGAQAILQPFLSRHARRLKAQIVLGERVVLLKDSGKTARAPVGMKILLRLNERRASNYAWQVDGVEGALQCTRRPDSADLPNDATFELLLGGPGVGSVKLSELAPPKLRHRRERHFVLRVIAFSSS